MDFLRYIKQFILPGDPTRFARELRSYPRQKEIWPANLNREIKRNWKIGIRWNEWKKLPRIDKDELLLLCDEDKLTDDEGKHYFYRRRVEKLAEKIQYKFSRKRGGKKNVYWYFTQYDDYGIVDWVQFDLDCHGEKDYFHFCAKIDKLQSMLPAQSVIWTTSPGSTDPNKGKVRGIYCWLFLDKNYMVRDLRLLVHQFLDQNDLDVEFSWQSKRRNIRLPGQDCVEVCDPDELIISHPVQKRQIEALEAFNNELDGVVPCSIEQLINQPMPAEKMVQKQSVTKMEAPIIKTPPSNSNNLPVHTAEAKDIRRIGNTYDALAREKDSDSGMACANIFSKILLKYRKADAHRKLQARPEAFSRAVDELMSMAPHYRQMGRGGENKTSATCSEREKLYSFCKRVLIDFDNHFDLSKCPSLKRDLQDAERFKYCKILRSKDIVRNLNCPYRHKAHIARIFHRMKEYNGRLAAKEIYEGDNPLCTRRIWFAIRYKYFTILDEHSHEEHKCRQMGLKVALVNKTKESNEIKEHWKDVLKKGERKKRGIVSVYTSSRKGTNRLFPQYGNLILQINGQFSLNEDKIMEECHN